MEPVTFQTAGKFFKWHLIFFAFLEDPKAKKNLIFFSIICLGFLCFLALLDEDTIIYDRVKKRQKKGYVRFITNFGALNIEIHADFVSSVRCT